MAVRALTTTRMAALERAHSDLVARIANARPPRIHGAADAADTANRADHMAAVHAATIEYLEAVLADTVGRLSVAPGCRGEVEQALFDEINGRTGDLAAKLQQAGVRFALQREAA